MITTDIINVDLAKPGAMHVVNAVQNDKYSRNVVANLYLNGSKFLIPDGATVVASYNKPDGTGGIYDSMPDGSIAWNIDGNSVTVALAPQVLTAAGMVNFSITLIQDKFEISVFSISIHVHPLPSFTAQSEDYVNMRDWLSAELNKALEEAKASGEFKGQDGITPSVTVTNGKEADGRGNATIKVKYTFDGIVNTQSATIMDGRDGFTPIKGKDYFDGEDGQPGKDGEPGKDGADGVSATHSWNGTVLTITSASGTSSADLKGEKGETGAQGIQGEKGADGAKGDKGDKGDTGANGQNGADGKTPIKGVDYFTEADKNELVLMVINALGGNPVFGIVDENNNIIVSGNLANGTYTVKYEMEDGSTVNIGNLVLDNNVYYSVTNNLTNCTNSNSSTQVAKGESYSATISAKSGYELESVTVTMGGSPVSVSGGNISIAEVTGNIVITATATEIQTEPTEPTNFAEPNTTNKTDWSIWCNDARFGSDGAYRACTGKNNAVSNYIPVQVGDVLYINGMNIPTTGTSMEQGLLFAKSDKTMASASYLQWYLDLGYTTVTSDESTAAIIDTSGMANHDNGAAIAYVRVSGKVTGTLDEVEIKIKRNGRWL